MTFKNVKGTQDFYPEDKAVLSALKKKLVDVATKYNFKEIETPVFENIDLLTAKQGEEILSQIFTLEQKGKEKLGLRFDMTVPSARLFVSKQKEISKPVKWIYFDKNWRYERPQKGRLREFYQFGAEMFGNDSALGDAEVLNLMTDCYKSFGLTSKDFVIKVNNRKLLEGLVQDLGDAAKVIALIDKVLKLSDDEFKKYCKEIGVKPLEIKNILAYTFEDLAKVKMNKLAKEGYEELKSILKCVDSEFVQFDISIARGLSYYTGTVFEAFDKKGKYRAIGGGGRYDKMIEQFGGTSESATGFAIGIVTLSLLLEEKGLLPKVDFGPDYFVAVIGDVISDGLKLVQNLRKNNSVDYDFSRSLSKQMKYANTLGAKKLIVLGEEELKKGKFKIKDMKSGKEEIVDSEGWL